jgi:plasmid stability protein
MATLTIRQLDDEVYERLRERARLNNRSLEAEARQLLDERTRDLPALVDDLLEFHDRMAAKHGLLPDSTDLIREMRRDE